MTAHAAIAGRSRCPAATEARLAAGGPSQRRCGACGSSRVRRAISEASRRSRRPELVVRAKPCPLSNTPLAQGRTRAAKMRLVSDTSPSILLLDDDARCGHRRPACCCNDESDRSCASAGQRGVIRGARSGCNRRYCCWISTSAQAAGDGEQGLRLLAEVCAPANSRRRGGADRVRRHRPRGAEPIKRGAFDFITKPWDNVRLVAHAARRRLGDRQAMRDGQPAPALQNHPTGAATARRTRASGGGRRHGGGAGNLSAAARALGLSRAALYRRLERYGL